MSIINNLKICTRCQKAKTINDFGENREWCYTCRSDWSERYAKTHKAEIKAFFNAYKETNPFEKTKVEKQATFYQKRVLSKKADEEAN